MNYSNGIENENLLADVRPGYNYISEKTYLTFERSGTYDKNELHEGYRVPVLGGSLRHDKIISNLLGGIVPHLKDNRAKAFSGNIKVHIPSVESFTYPDIAITSDEPEKLDDGYNDVITNPSVIIEVVSPTTKKYDRGTKFFYYIKIPSLREYIIVDSLSMHVLTIQRQSKDSWQFNEVSGKQGILVIPTIQYQVFLSEVYNRIAYLTP